MFTVLAQKVKESVTQDLINDAHAKRVAQSEAMSKQQEQAESKRVNFPQKEVRFVAPKSEVPALKKNKYSCCDQHWTSAKTECSCKKCNKMCKPKSIVPKKEALVPGNEMFFSDKVAAHLCAVENVLNSCGIANQYGVSTTRHTITDTTKPIHVTLPASGDKSEEVITFAFSDGELLANDWIFFRYTKDSKFQRYADSAWLAKNKLVHRIPQIGQQSQVVGAAGAKALLAGHLGKSSSTITHVVKDGPDSGIMAHGASTDGGFSGCLVVGPKLDHSNSCDWIGMHVSSASPNTFFIPMSAAIWQRMAGGKASFPQPPSRA